MEEDCSTNSASTIRSLQKDTKLIHTPHAIKRIPGELNHKCKTKLNMKEYFFIFEVRKFFSRKNKRAKNTYHKTNCI